MRRALFLLLFLLVQLSFGQSIELTQTGSGYHFEVQLPAYSVTPVRVNAQLEDGTPICADFSKILIADLSANGEFGAPQLLSTTFDIAVESEDVTVKVEVLEADTITLKHKLYPKQVELPTSRVGDTPDYFSYDSEAYAANTISELVSVGDYYTYRTQKAATVYVNPVQYDAVTNRVIIVKRMSVDLIMSKPVMLRTGRSNLFGSVMRNKFANLRGAAGRSIPTEKFRGDEDYLVIATSEYINNTDLQRLIDYRKQQYNVEVVDASTITQTKDGYKSFIRGKMPTFCLLVGSQASFPKHTHTYANVTTKSVSYYVCAGGSTPNPDIAMGLFFVRNATEIKNIVDKIVLTEEKNDDNPRVFVGVGGNTQQMGQVAPDHCDRVVQQMYEDFYAYNDFSYVSSYSVKSGKTTCVNACNSGARVFNYNGHGFEAGWQYGWGNSELSSLTNTVYPFVLSCACLTGTYGKNCMAANYAYNKRGAVGFIGSYENSFGGQHGLNYGFTEALNTLDITRFGLAFINGQNCWTSPNATVLMPSSTGNVTMMQYQYHLFGDPATEVMNSVSTDPHVTISAPNGGEKWGQYSTREISWSSNVESPVAIELYKDGSLVETLAESEENDGSFEWLIPEDFTVGTGYSVVVKTVSGDLLEDESDGTFEVIAEEIITEYPYVQDFENFQPVGGFNPGTGKDGYDTATIAMEGWAQCSDDDLEVLSIMGATPSHIYAYPTKEGTGTDGDHTNGNGVYLYTESSGGNDNMEAAIYSPVFDMSRLSEPKVEYFLHMRSDSARPGAHHLDICVDGHWTEDIVVDKEEHGAEWLKKEVALKEYVDGGKRVQFKVRTITGSAWDSDICFDDFQVSGITVSTLTTKAFANEFDMQVGPGSVSFCIPGSMADQKVNLTLYNLQGRVVERLYSGVAKVGVHKVSLMNSSNRSIAAGFYLCRLETGSLAKTVNVILK